MKRNRHNIKEDLSKKLSNSLFIRLHETLGVSKKQLTLIYKGVPIKDINLLVKLAAALNISIDECIKRYYSNLHKSYDEVKAKIQNKTI